MKTPVQIVVSTAAKFPSQSWSTTSGMQVDDTRQSAMSISSDLFPELLSWSAFIDMTQRSHSASPLPQGMPNDIAEDDSFDDAMTESEYHPPVSLSRIFDPTTIAIGFDVSYFDGLDEQLIYSPKEAFADLCWSDAMYCLTDIGETLKTVSAPSLPPSGSNLSSVESDLGPEECEVESEEPRVQVEQIDRPPMVKISAYDEAKDRFVKDNVRDYLVPFDYHFNADNSVGAFPIPVIKQSKETRGFTVFRSKWKFGRH